MAQRKINVTVVEISSRDESMPIDSSPVNSSPVNSMPVNRLERMTFAAGGRRGLFAGSGFDGHSGPSRANLIPGADPYIAQLVDRLSRQMAAESISRI